MSFNENKQPYVIVLGNEKGGTGKSTLSMHIIVHLLRLGFKVASIDSDARQGTLTRYVENRVRFNELNKLSLPTPEHHAISRSELENKQDAEKEDYNKAESVLASLANHDFIIIDTPGNDTYLSRVLHSKANVIITPLNDSFIDLDVLMKVQDLENNKITPSHYAEMVWEQKKQRLIKDKVSIDWIVVRNRLTNIASNNKEEMYRVLQLLSKRIGFRVGDGFAERVIFRELFLSGMTLLDLEETGQALRMSHLAARQELRNLLSMLNLPALEEKLQREA